ncbi:50S ribosomal protein L17 [Candidatus Saganbacteria bacterium]|nr:50S ribosomal protein L17 [Candidatus Saganbacteria bacterium]
MRHKLKLKKLGRPSDQRIAIINSGATALIKFGRVKMTLTRAKVIRRVSERLITLAKKGDIAARRQAYKVLKDRDIVKQLFEMAPRFADRGGGYTRLTKLPPRKGDAASLALIEFVA